MSGIEQHHADWEQLAELDPKWAILSSPDRRFGGWDDEEFFATGEREAERLLSRLDQTGGTSGRRAALDFGCGVGRISRALAGRYDEVVGVDISETMLAQGRALFPHLDTSEVTRWMGHRPCLPDSLPVIDRPRAVENAFKRHERGA